MSSVQSICATPPLLKVSATKSREREDIRFKLGVPRSINTPLVRDYHMDPQGCVVWSWCDKLPRYSPVKEDTPDSESAKGGSRSSGTASPSTTLQLPDAWHYEDLQERLHHLLVDREGENRDRISYTRLSISHSAIGLHSAAENNKTSNEVVASQSDAPTSRKSSANLNLSLPNLCTSKGKRGQQKADDSEDSDQPPEKSPRRHSSDCSGNTRDKEVYMLPCIVEGCPGKDRYLCQMLRKFECIHGIHICRRCWRFFAQKDEWKPHSSRLNCKQRCISDSCAPLHPESQGKNIIPHDLGPACGKKPRPATSIQFRMMCDLMNAETSSLQPGPETEHKDEKQALPSKQRALNKRVRELNGIIRQFLDDYQAKNMPVPGALAERISDHAQMALRAPILQSQPETPVAGPSSEPSLSTSMIETGGALGGPFAESDWLTPDERTHEGGAFLGAEEYVFTQEEWDLFSLSNPGVSDGVNFGGLEEH